MRQGYSSVSRAKGSGPQASLGRRHTSFVIVPGGWREGGGGANESVIPIGSELSGAAASLTGGKQSSQVPNTLGTDRSCSGPARSSCVTLGKPVNLSVLCLSFLL